MNDRNFYERRLGNPGYDAVARKKIKELEKAVGGGSGGGGGIFLIVATLSFGSNEITNIDKTYDEIVEVYNAGMLLPVLELRYSGMSAPGAWYYFDGGVSPGMDAGFWRVGYGSNVYVEQVFIHPDGTSEFKSVDLQIDSPS